MAIGCLWNRNGTILAVCGNKTDGSNTDSNVVMFYTAFGVVSKFHNVPIFCFIPLYVPIFIASYSIYEHLRFLVEK